MTDQQTRRKGRPRGRPFKPGQSGNPAGRPRTGLSLAEKIRDGIDLDRVIELANELLGASDISADEKLKAILPLLKMGYVQPPQGIEIRDERPRQLDYSNLSLAEKRVWLELARKVALPAPITEDS